MKESVTLRTGEVITFAQAVKCNPGEVASPLHDWIYLMSEKLYKCRRCGMRITKIDLKELTD